MNPFREPTLLSPLEAMRFDAASAMLYLSTPQVGGIPSRAGGPGGPGGEVRSEFTSCSHRVGLSMLGQKNHRDSGIG